jgi:hypothetical protein
MTSNRGDPALLVDALELALWITSFFMQLAQRRIFAG